VVLLSFWLWSIDWQNLVTSFHWNLGLVCLRQEGTAWGWLHRAANTFYS
jgi:hypothetical protein